MVYFSISLHPHIQPLHDVTRQWYYSVKLLKGTTKRYLTYMCTCDYLFTVTNWTRSGFFQKHVAPCTGTRDFYWSVTVAHEWVFLMIILFSILPNTIKLKPVVLRKENEDQILNKCLKLLNYGIKKKKINVGFSLFSQYKVLWWKLHKIEHEWIFYVLLPHLFIQ